MLVRSLWLLGSCLGSVACSTVTVRVPVLRPAEINLRGKSEIVLYGLEGEEPAGVESALKDAIARSPYLTLIDRQHLERVMHELELSQSDLADAATRRRLGKQMTGSVLLAGRVDQNSYAEHTWENEQECTRNDNGKTVTYRCIQYFRKGEANLAVGFDLVDIETGENVKPKRVTCSRQTVTQSTDHNPRREDRVSSIVRAVTGHEKPSQAPPIDRHALITRCQEEVVDTFMRAVAPWQDYVSAAFKKDGDVPQLEMGIGYAHRGDWSAALAKFKEGLEYVRGQPGLSADTVAKVHWDLGLAYEYTGQFDEAEAEVKKAYEMSGDEDFLGELESIRRLKEERRRLVEQTGGEGGSS